MLQSLFQKGTKITNSFSKLGTKWPHIGRNKMNNKNVQCKMKDWTKSEHDRATNQPKLGICKMTDPKIPFKMKRKEIVKTKKMKIKMKTNSKQHNFGKPKWKIKLEI
jgi:hypothetical protein